jgi:hypothetical protein
LRGEKGREELKQEDEETFQASSLLSNNGAREKFPSLMHPYLIKGYRFYLKPNLIDTL